MGKKKLFMFKGWGALHDHVLLIQYPITATEFEGLLGPFRLKRVIRPKIVPGQFM
jgi:hypothetical protein